MSNKQNTVFAPKLRFPEFKEAEDWQPVPLNRLATRSKQKNRDEKIIRVLTNSAEFGVIDQRDFFDKDIATQGNLESYYVVELGSYVYNPRISATAPVGPISKNKIGTGVMSPLYTVFKFNDENNEFYEHYFKTAGWHGYMRQASSTGARHDRMAISSEDFMAMPLPVTTPKEQQKIADCLSSLDELITTQTRKVDALKTHKKGLMQQLFPCEGESRPRLRFPEFQNADEWKETCVGELGELIAGLTYSPDDVRETGLLVLRSSNIQNGKITLEDNVYVDPAIKGANLSQPNDILICVRNGSKALIGKSALIPEVMPLCTHGAFMTVFRAETPQFVFQLFQTAKYQKQVAGDLGATINSINGSQFKKYKFLVPKLPEQQRIATFLCGLDSLITAENQNLEALMAHKNGLLQQLFPSLEEVEA